MGIIMVWVFVKLVGSDCYYIVSIDLYDDLR